nr:immunoglobulin light chain junction region [Macaca mulatta]MOV68000.1 immunoglobulin light chain junction region [Macaca mulatta]
DYYCQTWETGIVLF